VLTMSSITQERTSRRVGSVTTSSSTTWRTIRCRTPDAP
jgi:hypothetical protein